MMSIIRQSFAKRAIWGIAKNVQNNLAKSDRWSERKDLNFRPLSPQNSTDPQNPENATENGLFCSVSFRFGSRQKFAIFRCIGVCNECHTVCACLHPDPGGGNLRAAVGWDLTPAE